LGEKESGRKGDSPGKDCNRQKLGDSLENAEQTAVKETAEIPIQKSLNTERTSVVPKIGGKTLTSRKE